LAQTRPTAVLEIEQSANRIVTNHVRQQIAERLARFNEDEVRIVEALTEHLDQRRVDRDDGPLDTEDQGEARDPDAR
jgi:hypothetical protein